MQIEPLHEQPWVVTDIKVFLQNPQQNAPYRGIQGHLQCNQVVEEEPRHSVQYVGQEQVLVDRHPSTVELSEAGKNYKGKAQQDKGNQVTALV